MSMCANIERLHLLCSGCEKGHTADHDDRLCGPGWEITGLPHQCKIIPCNCKENVFLVSLQELRTDPPVLSILSIRNY